MQYKTRAQSKRLKFATDLHLNMQQNKIKQNKSKKQKALFGNNEKKTNQKQTILVVVGCCGTKTKISGKIKAVEANQSAKQKKQKKQQKTRNTKKHKKRKINKNTIDISLN